MGRPLFGHSVAATLWALIVVGWVGPATADDGTGLSVRGIAVDATAESTTAARDRALLDGQRLALDRLLRRLVLRADHGALPRVPVAGLQALVLDLEVEEERSSSTRYIAKLNVRFRPEAIRTLLSDAGLAFSETAARPRLLLPVLENGGVSLLWEDANDWFGAWQARSLDPASPYPLVLPRGDQGDQVGLALAPTGRADDPRVLNLAARYELRDAVVARAVLDSDPANARPRLQVSLRSVGSALAGPIGQFTISVESREQIGALLAEGVERTVVRLEEDWKRDNLLRMHSVDRVSVRVPIENLATWVDVRRRLSRTSVVKGIEVNAISRTDAQIVIEYFGDVQQLSGALGQQDLSLTESDGFWVLRPLRSSAGGSGQ